MGFWRILTMAGKIRIVIGVGIIFLGGWQVWTASEMLTGNAALVRDIIMGVWIGYLGIEILPKKPKD
jgi:hypothetical protein